MKMGNVPLAKRFGSIAYIQVQLDLTNNGQSGQKIVSDLFSEVSWKITKL